MRIVWLGIQCSYSHSATALPLLAQASEGVMDVEWCRVDGVIADAPFVLASQCVRLKPELICATLYLFNREAVLAVLSRVSILLPQLKIAVGGPECLGMGAQELLRRYPFVTYAFRGEGEGVFRAFLERMRDGMSYPISALVERAPGGHIRDDGGCAVDTQWASRSPAVHSVFFEAEKPFVQIETSRGCPMGCSYCTSGHTHLRFRELEDVIAELRLLHDKGIREVRLLDRTFNVPDERGAALLSLFRTEFPDMHFHLELHPGVLGRLVRKELKQALPGQLFIEVGIQSTQPVVLKAIGRSGDSHADLDGLAFLCNLYPQFETHADLLTGLPEQELPGIFADVDALLGVGVAEIQMEVLKVLHGTALEKQAADFGMDYSAEPPYDVMRTHHLSLEDMIVCRRLSRMLDIFHNHAALRSTYVAAHRSLPAFTSRFLEWCCGNAPEILQAPSSLRRRMEVFHVFLKNEASAAALAYDELASAWMRCAFAPGQGAALNAEFIQALPHSTCIPAVAEDFLHRNGTRICQLPLSSGKMRYFLYNRAIAPNHCCAEF